MIRANSGISNGSGLRWLLLGLRIAPNFEISEILGKSEIYRGNLLNRLRLPNAGLETAEFVEIQVFSGYVQDKSDFEGKFQEGKSH